ncbi:MAG: hypothetical protein HOP14_06190, partial [Acidobacteria bacterium]|nr:hypothetical protein [Acidobacteriota bacterium]
VGAVSMDMLAADVTGLEVEPGDEVVLLGRQGDAQARIDVREMAAAIGTIPWEIVCRIGTRIEREYSGARQEGAADVMPGPARGRASSTAPEAEGA